MVRIMIANSAELGNRLDPTFHLTIKENMEKLREISGNIKKIKEFSLGKIQRGKSPGKTGYLDAGIPIIKTADITETFIDWRNCRNISERFYSENKNAQPLLLDIMVTSTGVGSVGRVDIFDEKNKKCLCSAKISTIHLRTDLVDPYYLVAFLRSKYGKVQIENSARGCTGQVELYSTDIEEIAVPLPNIETQDHIAKLVKNARKKWEECCQGLTKAQTEFEELLQLTAAGNSAKKSYIVSFSDLGKRIDASYYEKVAVLHKKEVSQYWKMMRIADFANVLRGVTPSRNNYTPTGIKVIKTVSLTGKGLSRTFGFVPRSFCENGGLRAQNGDILVASTGAGSIGKTDVFNLNENAIVVAEISIVRISNPKIDPYYVYLFFNTKSGRAQLEQAGRGATGQQHLYPRDISDLTIPVPANELFEVFKPTLQLAKKSLILKNDAEETIIAAKNSVENMIDPK